MAVSSGAACGADLEGTEPAACGGAFSLRLDNDLLGGRGQDQGYTAGARASWSHPLREGCMASGDDTIIGNRIREVSAPGLPAAYTTRSEIVSLEYALYTPGNPEATRAVRGDRPYAGLLMLSLGQAARTDSAAALTGLHIGLVGPMALGRQVHQGSHRLMGSERFRGWDDQLDTELLLGLSHERRRRWRRPHSARGHALAWDAISRWGGMLGNRATDVHAGWEIRIGTAILDDFGSFPGRDGGASWPSATSPQATGTWSGHLFLSTGVRWLIRDITLDGNTFERSHRVQRKPLAAEAGYGFVLTRGLWSIALLRVYRTREFEGQRNSPVHGSLLIVRSL